MTIVAGNRWFLMEYLNRHRGPLSATISPVLQWHVVLANPSLSFQKANWSLENLFAIVLAQLKTVLIKVAIQLAFFRRVETLKHQHLWVRIQAENGQKQSTFFWNSSVYFCSDMKAISCEKLPRNWRSCRRSRCVLLPSQNSANWL
jgi:fumarate reductase subunit D